MTSPRDVAACGETRSPVALPHSPSTAHHCVPRGQQPQAGQTPPASTGLWAIFDLVCHVAGLDPEAAVTHKRSEERRVGKEGRSWGAGVGYSNEKRTEQSAIQNSEEQ